jgi:hypothetical protein
MAVHHFPEKVQHAHAVVGVGCSPAGNHAREIPGLDRVDGGSANAHLGVRVLGVQAAGSHGAVLAAGRVRTDGAGFHVCGTVKGCLNAVPLSFSKHLGRGITDRGRTISRPFFSAFFSIFFPFSSSITSPPSWFVSKTPSWRLVTILDKTKKN